MKESRGATARAVPWPWLLALLAAGAALRLAGLTERGLWLDEWVSLDVASHPWVEVATGRVFDNHTPPLYYLLLRGWLALVSGASVPEATLPGVLAAARGLSVALDLAVLALLTRAAGRWFGRRVGLAAGLAYAASPFAVRVAQEARMYPLLMLLVLAAGVLAVEAERRPERTWLAAALAPVAAAALYTHYFAALSLAAITALVGWRLWRRPDDPARPARWRLLAAMAAAGLMFVPWLPVLVRLLRSGGQSFRGSGWSELPQAVLRFTVGYSALPATVQAKGDLWGWALAHLPLLLTLGVSATGILLLGTVRALRSSTSPLLLTLAFAPPILGLATSMAVPSLDERYLSISFPFVLLLAVLGVGEAMRRWRQGRQGGRSRRLALAGVVVAASLVALGAFGAVSQLLDPDAGATPWRPAAEELRRVATPGARVVVEPAFYGPLVSTYLGDRFDVVGGGPPPVGPDGVETWSLRVAFLTAGIPPAGPGWRAEPHRLFADGNGIRLVRLVPAVTVGAGTGGALTPAPGPSPPPTARPSPPAPPTPAAGRVP